MDSSTRHDLSDASSNGSNGHALGGSQAGPRPGPVCNVCPLFRTCRRICPIVEAEQLPSMERGRIDPEDLPRLFMGMRMTRALLDNEHLLTGRQQDVIRLYYRDSLRQHEIAERLGVTQQAVNDALHRARSTVGKLLVGGTA